MKRDMDLIRLLLLEVEAEEPKPDLSAYTKEQRIYHTALLIEAGFIDGTILPNGDGYPVATTTIRLTWHGHEFLDAARNDTVWNKAREKVKSSGVQITVAVLEELLKSLLKASLGLSD
jgi:hypothetical protein